ncbi:MAG: class I SAM-dependent methyltransferase [Candidatus Pacebacteria bacterium]|jgi:ubiquinone/menaquinone biosynthesis C-methylase UbiE|nr:class I SAM-dependent methyltransferase [Candidatus Paceibacterota bacterium]
MFANPETIIRQCALSEGMQVADLGAGSGAYAIAAARHVRGGKVYAVEVQKELLTRIQNEASHAHLTNIEILWGNIEKYGGTKLKDASMDFVIASNVLFQVEDRNAFVREISRVTKPGGRVLLVDWSDSFGGMGPSGEHVITKPIAESFFISEGFLVEKEVSAGAHHYGILFNKPVVSHT